MPGFPVFRTAATIVFLAIAPGLTRAAPTPPCQDAKMATPRFSADRKQATISWTATPGAKSYNVRMDDGSTDRIKDDRFANCANAPLYYCVNGVQQNAIANVPLQSDRVYKVWVNPNFGPGQPTCQIETSFAQAAFPAQTKLAARNRILLFMIDRGFGNGLMETRDEAGLDRIVDSLRPLQSKFDVRVIINPRSADPAKNEWIMNALASRQMRFVVDAYASDTMTMGENAITKPADVSHGISQSPETLQMWKKKWPTAFSGLMAHELFSVSRTINICRTRQASWCKTFSNWMPEGDFYNSDLLSQLADLAARHKMPLFFIDPYWRTLHGDDKSSGNAGSASANEASLRRIIESHPGTIYVLYANNEPNDAQWSHETVWPTALQPFVAAGAAGFGLSDQSWYCSGAPAAARGWNDTNCPIDAITRQAQYALSVGASVLEFEPTWYLWKVPRGVIGKRVDYPADPNWGDRGTPTPRFEALERALGATP